MDTGLSDHLLYIKKWIFLQNLVEQHRSVFKRKPKWRTVAFVKCLHYLVNWFVGSPDDVHTSCTAMSNQVYFYSFESASSQVRNVTMSQHPCIISTHLCTPVGLANVHYWSVVFLSSCKIHFHTSVGLRKQLSKQLVMFKLGIGSKNNFENTRASDNVITIKLWTSGSIWQLERNRAANQTGRKRHVIRPFPWQYTSYRYLNKVPL